MGVKGVNLHALDLMPQNDVVPIIRQGRVGVDVGNRAVGCGHDGVGRLPMLVALQAADVQAFMDLPAIRTHATKRAADPGFADGADEKLSSPPFSNRGVIGCRQQKLLGPRRQANAMSSSHIRPPFR